jgi:hypothetical protein
MFLSSFGLFPDGSLLPGEKPEHANDNGIIHYKQIVRYEKKF